MSLFKPDRIWLLLGTLAIYEALSVLTLTGVIGVYAILRLLTALPSYCMRIANILDFSHILILKVQLYV